MTADAHWAVDGPLLQAQPDQSPGRLALLYDIGRSFAELIELDDLIPFVIAKTKEVLNAEGSAILLFDDSTQELYFPYSSDVDAEVEQRFSCIRFPADRGIAGWVLQHETPQLVPDVSKDERWYGQVDKQSGMATVSLLCAPLRTRRGKLGVIELRNKTDGDFTQADLDFLNALAGSIATAIENARLYQRLKQSEAKLRDEVLVLSREMASLSRFGNIIGTSAAMERVFRMMESAIAAPVTVLLQGETGTGKELIARAIHYNGPRKERPFVTVNCGALPETLLESELFGHKRGAFTGAVADRKGFFEVADGGTIFLDEIAEMTPAMQVKVLRVLEDGEIRRVGETELRWVDVRIISATNRDLEEETKQGKFREDLFYRLSVFPISVPPLRTRKEDVPLLVAHVLQRTAAKFGKPIPGVSPVALNAILDYPWPGNVRELENEIERAVAVAVTAEAIQLDHLSEKLTARRPPRSFPGTLAMSLKRARERFEHDYLTEVLREHRGNVSGAAKALGISRVMLGRKIKSYGLRMKAIRDQR